jgi:hypothetical protein
MWSVDAAEDSDPVRLTTNPDNQRDTPVGYSPDGTQIAIFRFNPEEAVALFTIDADGTDLRQITRG